jgi:dihydrofolate reductase
MAKLIYGMNTSLDGFIEDDSGNFDWAAPSEQVHSFWNDFERNIGTYLYGRRLYDTMAVWETLDDPEHPVAQDFATIWRSADKIVFSRSLRSASSARTRIEREFSSDSIRQLKSQSARDITIGGPELAAQAFRAGLIDELHLVVHPILLGAGKPALPANLRLALRLLDEGSLDGRAVHLHYAVADHEQQV